MAKPRGKKTPAAVSERAIKIQIRPDVKADTPSYYVNYAGIGHNEFEFTMNVLRIPASLTAEQIAYAERGEQVPVEPILQLVLPPRLIDGLIRALTSRKERYEREFGPIRQTGEKNEVSKG